MHVRAQAINVFGFEQTLVAVLLGTALPTQPVVGVPSKEDMIVIKIGFRR
jgi:hypothetical protein